MKFLLHLFLLSSTSFGAFGQLTDSLSNSSNRFNSLESALSNPSQVNYLYLDGNLQNNKFSDLQKLKNLRGLYLENFSDSIILTEVSKLPYLQELTLINDGFEYIPKSFLGLKCLQRLDLIGDSNLNLTQAFTVISQLPNLTQLRLERLNPNQITNDLLFPITLETLSLRNNNLETVPKWVTRLPRLELLDIGENFISDQSLKTIDFSPLQNLRVLFLDHERNLTSQGIIPILNTLPSLEVVHLEESLIQQVNNEINEHSLKELMLDPSLLNTSPAYIPHSMFLTSDQPLTEGAGAFQIPLSK